MCLPGSTAGPTTRPYLKMINNLMVGPDVVPGGHTLPHLLDPTSTVLVNRAAPKSVATMQ